MQSSSYGDIQTFQVPSSHVCSKRMIHLDLTLIEMICLFLFLPFQTGSWMIWNTVSPWASLCSLQKSLGIEMCPAPFLLFLALNSRLFSLLIPKSPCKPLPFAVCELRGHSSALNRHGTNKLLYFVCQTLPTCLFILLQSPNELVQRK